MDILGQILYDKTEDGGKTFETQRSGFGVKKIVASTLINQLYK